MSVATLNTIPANTTVVFNETINNIAPIEKLSVSFNCRGGKYEQISFSNKRMSYDFDANTFGVVRYFFTQNSWNDTRDREIITTKDYTFENDEVKQWWIDNSDLTIDKLITKNNKGDKTNMAEIILNRPNWLGSEVGLVRKTVTVTQSSGTYVTENGRKIIKSGTLINDDDIGYGLLWNDADVTDASGKIASIMIRGTYIDDKLPTSIATQATTLAQQGLYNIQYADTVIAYGEVTD